MKISFIKNPKEFKSYFRSLIPYILVSGLIFSFGIVMGFSFANEFPEKAQEFISLLTETYSPIIELESFPQLLFIFLRNSIISFLVVIGGIIFAILPLLVLLSNGEALGLLANMFNPSYFLMGIIPHGILEIPAFFISSAMGLKFGVISVKKVLRKEKISLKKELNLALEVFIKIVLPLFLLAAVIEVLITPELLRVF